MKSFQLNKDNCEAESKAHQTIAPDCVANKGYARFSIQQDVAKSLVGLVEQLNNSNYTVIG